MLREYENGIGQMKSTLVNLKDLERVIQKRDVVDKAFFSIPISLKSLDTLQASVTERIKLVKSEYGEDEWNARVDDLSKKLFPTGTSRNYLQMYVDLLINPANIFSPPRNLGRSDRSSEEIFSCIVATFFDPTIEWQVIKTSLVKNEDKVLEVYSWESLYPRDTLHRETFVSNDEEIEKSPRKELDLFEKSGPGQYQIALKRKDDKEICVLDEFTVDSEYSSSKTYDLLARNKWKKKFWPIIRDWENVKTPWMLASLGDALLKEWKSTK